MFASCRFGFDTTVSQLLTVPPYVFASESHRGRSIGARAYKRVLAIVLLVFAIWSDRIKKRSPFILAGLLMCLIGFVINISNASIGAKYFGTYFCIGGSYAAFPGIVSWYAMMYS